MRISANRFVYENHITTITESWPITWINNKPKLIPNVKCVGWCLGSDLSYCPESQRFGLMVFDDNVNMKLDYWFHARLEWIYELFGSTEGKLAEELLKNISLNHPCQPPNL